MDQVSEENSSGPIDPNFDFSAYLAEESEIPSEVSLESPPLAATELQPVHEFTFEQFYGLDFNIPPHIKVTPPEDPRTGELGAFKKSLDRQPKLVIPHYEDGIYRNRILNSFKSPDVPLSVIDNLRFPFDDELQNALEKALEQQRQESENALDLQRKESERQDLEFDLALLDALNKELGPENKEPARQNWIDLDAPYEIANDNDNSELEAPNYQNQTLHAQPNFRPNSLPLADPRSAIVESAIKRRKNKRSENRLNFDPLVYYQPLPTKPASWGPKTRNGEHLFRYTAKGELLPELLLTIEQVGYFIQHNPLNYISGNPVPDPKNSGLILWIQTVPADSSKRYGNAVSAKCRLKDCPEPHNTILKGDFRVAFDEQSSQHPRIDPFHCAGYAHLYCMEKFFNFPQICRTFNVQPDTRALPEGRNRMAITRDHLGMLDIVENYIRRFSWQGPRPHNEYKHYLNCKLTKYHIKKQPLQKQQDRDIRASNSSIDVTLNNLEEYVRNKTLQNAEKKAGKVRHTRKRKMQIVEASEESDLDDTILSRDMVDSRYPKRAKVSSGDGS